MPAVTTSYVMFVPRRRRIGGAGSTIDLIPPATNAVSGDAHAGAPDTIQVHYPDPDAPPAPANFAFWSVVGSTDGEYTSRPGTPGNYITVHTGADPVTVTAWYVYAGGGGTNGNGTELETDAFLVDENQFVEPTPIESVNPASAWDHSDVDEFVFTAQASDLVARDSVVDAREHFETWYALEGGSTPGAGRSLHVPAQDNGIAVATYRIPPSPDLNPPHRGGTVVGTIVGGVAHDGNGGVIINGVYHHIGPWNPFLAALAVYNSAQALPAASRARVQFEAMGAMAAEAERIQKDISEASRRTE